MGGGRARVLASVLHPQRAKGKTRRGKDERKTTGTTSTEDHRTRPQLAVEMLHVLRRVVGDERSLCLMGIVPPHEPTAQAHGFVSWRWVPVWDPKAHSGRLYECVSMHFLKL